MFCICHYATATSQRCYAAIAEETFLVQHPYMQWKKIFNSGKYPTETSYRTKITTKRHIKSQHTQTSSLVKIIFHSFYLSNAALSTNTKLQKITKIWGQHQAMLWTRLGSLKKFSERIFNSGPAWREIRSRPHNRENQSKIQELKGVSSSYSVFSSALWTYQLARTTASFICWKILKEASISLSRLSTLNIRTVVSNITKQN